MKHVARMGEMRNEYSLLDENLKRRGHLGVPGCRWKNTTKMNLK